MNSLGVLKQNDFLYTKRVSYTCMKVYFSDFFGIEHSVVEGYGALDVSLIADMPVFIDPFCLFASDKKEYNHLHQRIIEYLRFLRDMSENPTSRLAGVIKHFFAFPEFPYTYMGFCSIGSSGHGLGMRFANALRNNLSGILGSFGTEQVSEASHLEKLCVICEGVGVDCISDFTTNLIKDFLLEYTQEFSEKCLRRDQCDWFTVQHAWFDFAKHDWRSGEYLLPKWKGHYVVLVPKDILTKDDTWINKKDLVHDLRRIPDSIGNEELKGKFIALLNDILDEKKKYTTEQKDLKIIQFCKEYPEAIDWYIKGKETRKDEAREKSAIGVATVTRCLFDEPRLLRKQLTDDGFYSLPMTSLDEVLEKARFFKHAIESRDVYRIFYDKEGRHISEKMVQLVFRLVWVDSEWDINPEPNSGRGPADFVVSLGANDKCVVEIKLASNSHLEKNLRNQLDIYKSANATSHGVFIIVYTSDKEEQRMDAILTKLGLNNSPYIVTIDARPNKVSASKVG